MALSDYETKQLQEIEQWADDLHLEDAWTNDFVEMYDRWLDEMISFLPEEIYEKIFVSMDQFLLYIQVALQETKRIRNKSENILEQARIWNANIEEITDLHKLPLEKLQYLAKREMDRYHLYSLMQGSLTGTGKTLFVTGDLPVLLLINLRAIQSIGLCYGFPVHHPEEAFIALKTFHSAILPKRFRATGWQELMDLIKTQDFFAEQIIDIRSLHPILLQLVKTALILLFRKENNISPVSLAIGAGSNYMLTKQVTGWANRFYQYRYLLEKSNK